MSDSDAVRVRRARKRQRRCPHEQRRAESRLCPDGRRRGVQRVHHHGHRPHQGGKIQYRALTSYLLSASDFLDNYNALKQSCDDLIGTAGITAGDCTEVGKALDAVEMANSWPCSPAQAAVPLFCALGEVPSNLFFDNLENTSSGNWATTTISGVNHWFYPMLPNPLEFGPFATSGTQNIWGYDWAALGDSAIAMTSSVGIPAGARLQFNHAYGFESDGGVIEYSTDGGGNWLDAGSLISGGATYGGAIPAAGGNPLAGRSGFVGDSFGYTASQLDLASLAGQNVRFRFRMGTGSSSVDDFGWFIDDVRIYRCVLPDPQPFRDVRRPVDINLGADLVAQALRRRTSRDPSARRVIRGSPCTTRIRSTPRPRSLQEA
jgi:hypothetical protein